MKLFNFDRVLCLSPHPDDVEYSMLGTIMKYSKVLIKQMNKIEERKF